ncbi:hypothetical protein MtrunA17_Chr4g0006081 [Medicago truncatula]|uniref:Uncharacterized protein n=1 Tax=Medicago truncatula TaxID=3880 RepID=A0A396HZL2_MEDTR|nr:hypothetical protein MtrunA17_Chr4g0006081 [Medicago truncatula]
MRCPFASFNSDKKTTTMHCPFAPDPEPKRGGVSNFIDTTKHSALVVITKGVATKINQLINTSTIHHPSEGGTHEPRLIKIEDYSITKFTKQRSTYHDGSSLVPIDHSWETSYGKSK